MEEAPRHRCANCRRTFGGAPALKSHYESKPRCRRRAPPPEGGGGVAGPPACGGCGRAFGDAGALKAHCRSKPACRAAAPEALRAEIEAEEAGLRGAPNPRRSAPDSAPARGTCGTCGGAFGDEGALKAHYWSKPSCRGGAPEALQAEIAGEELCAAQLPACLDCGRRFLGGEDALITHAWAKAGCRAGLTDAQRARVEE